MQNPAWLQLKFDLDAAAAEEFSDALQESGALSVSLTDAKDQAILEPEPGTTPLWDAVRVVALYAADSEPQLLMQRIRALIAPMPLPSCAVARLQDQAWERVWMKRFQPMRFGERLWIRPSWAELDEGDGAVIVDLDPGLAFGTGSHETTALCLEWLDGADLQGKSVIDYGCGSGILAIAALKLGAAGVLATDIDPQALTASAGNARNNGVDCSLLLYPPEELPGDPADLVMANILSGPLLELAPRLAGLVRVGGSILLSGVLADQIAGVADGYSNWFKMEPALRKGDWGALTGTRLA